MNKTKRLLSVILALVLTLGSFPVSVGADEVSTCAHCGVELVDGAIHAEDCLTTTCSCDPKPAEGEAHGELCPLYQPETPAEEETDPVPVETEPEQIPTPSTDATEPVIEPSEPDVEPDDEVIVPPATGTTLTTTVDGTNFELTGDVIPEGAEAVVKKTNPAMLGALSELGISEESAELFDISVEVEGEKWQPGAAVMLLTADAEPVDNTVTMTIDGLDVEAGQEVTIYHFFDDPNAIMNALMAGKAQELDVSGHEDMFAAELEAASYFEPGDGIIYYETIEIVAAQDNLVTFDTQSFSTYVVSSGNTLTGSTPWGDGFILDGNHTYYVMPNTKMTLYTSDATWKHPNLTLGTAQTWTVGTNNHGITSPTSKQKSFTFFIKAGDSHIGETFTVKGGSYTATIKVTNKETIIKQAITKTAYDVYLTSLADSRTLPGEPAISSAARVYLPDKLANKAEGIVKETFATSPYLRTSTDGTSTIGIFDASGANITPHLNIDWTAQLKAIINKAKADGTTLKAANGNTVTSATGYKLVPYVVKLQTANGGASWNIDCYIVPTSSMITLQYNYNLPANLSYSAGVPNSAVGASSITTKVASSPAATNITLTNPNGDSYYYVFKGWCLNAGGTGTLYKPGDSITVSKNTTLYGKWVARYKYVLKYDFKGGSGSHTELTKAYTEGLSSHTFTWTVADPTRTNYVFKGWSSNGDNTTVEIPAGTKKVTITGTAGRSKTTTLYAVWAPKYKYVLNFNMKGGSNGPANITKDWTESYSSHTFTWTAEPTKTGYTFAGWSTADDNTPEITAGTKSYTVAGTAAGTKTTTLYACWTINQYGYTVKYLDKDTGAEIATTEKGTANYGSTVNGTQKTISGYSFDSVSPTNGSITIGTNPDNNVITYYYTENRTTIHYEVDGPDGCGTVDLNDTDPATTAGTKVSETGIKVVNGDPVGATAAASSNHYTFLGWYDKNGTQLSTNFSYDPTRTAGAHWADTTYYARFVENEATINYKVVGDVGGDVSLDSEVLKVLTSTATGSTATVAEGYRFMGWYNDEECVSTNDKYVPTRPTGGWVDGTTYWAKFEKLIPIHYEVVGPENCGTVDLNDNTSEAGTKVTETVTEETGNAVGATAAAANSNFKFVGWYETKECTGDPLSTDPYYDPQKPTDGNWAEKTYYAKFEYTIGNLVISKSGIEEVDHHGASGSNKQEQQSTVYTVKGTALDGTKVDMEVVLVGNSAITIQNIPVGTYTVTEKGSWSWRYDAEGASSQKVTVTGGQTTTAEFENSRNRSLWLSGDNFLRNLFTAITN